MPSPRFIELQISGTTLGGMVLNRARTQVFWAADPIQLTNPGDGIVDHIAFDDDPGVILSLDQSTQTVLLAGGGTGSVSGPKVRFQLGLKIFVKLISVAQDPSQPESEYALLPGGIPTTLSLDLSLTGGANTELCLEVADLTSILAIPQLDAALQNVKTQLQSAGPLCVPFDVSAISALVGNVQAQNVVLAAQTDNVGNVTAVGIRIEVGSAPADNLPDWQNFVTAFQSTLSTAGPDWNILIDPQILVDYAAGQFQSGLAGLSGYSIDSPVTGSWIVPGAFGGGQIALSDDGHFAVSECPNNIGVTITATMDLQLAAGDLVEHGFIDWDLSDSDVFLCGISYGGPIGALVGTLVAPGIGTIIGGIIGGIVGSIVFGIIAGVMSGNKTLVGNFNSPSCTVGDQHHVTCTSPLDLPTIEFGNGVGAALSVATMLGMAKGLLLGGTAAVTKVGDPMFNISQPDDSAPLGIVGQCFSFQPGFAFSVALTGSDGPPSGPTTALYGTPTSPTIEVLNDPLNVFSYLPDPDSTIWPPMSLDFVITLNQDDPYFNNPYRPTLYVRTTSGAYSVLLPELLPYTKSTLQGVEQNILNADIGCNKLESGWLGNPGGYNPHWSVDPGPEGDINIWEITIAGLATGEAISAHTSQGVQLATAPATGLYAQLSIAVSGVNGEVGGAVPIGFARGAERGAASAAVAAAGSIARALGAHADRKRAANVAVQRSLRRRSSWSALGGALRRVALGVYQNQICAIIAGSDGVEIVGLRVPARPTLVAMVRDAAGAMPLSGGLLTWNDGGLWYDGRRLAGAAAEGPIEAVVAHGGSLYALGRAGILIFNGRLEHTGRIAADGATHIVAIAGKLVLADGKGLQIHDLAAPAKPVAGPVFPLEGIRAIDATTIGGEQRVLTELNSGQFVVVDVSGERPYIAARYFERPWFAGAATLRDVTVRPAGPGYIEVFTPGTRKSMRF